MFILIVFYSFGHSQEEPSNWSKNEHSWISEKKKQNLPIVTLLIISFVHSGMYFFFYFNNSFTKLNTENCKCNAQCIFTAYGDWNWIKQRGNILKPKKKKWKTKKTHTRRNIKRAESRNTQSMSKAISKAKWSLYVLYTHNPWIYAGPFLFFYVIFHTMPKWLVFYALHVVVVSC